MPTNGTARGLSALAGFGLFMTAIVLCYLNATTSAVTWSTIYVTGIIVTSLAMAAKWATALGVETKVVEIADKIASFIPWVALYFTAIQALHYTRDGLDGLMAGVAIIALVFLVFFGVFDSIASLAGKKFKEATEALSEASHRVSAASSALSGNRNQ